MWSIGFSVQGLGLSLGFGVLVLGSRVKGLGIRVLYFGCRV